MDLEKIKEEYFLPAFEDDDKMTRIKEVLRGLSLAEQNIFVIYCEEGTYAGLARNLKCSLPTARKRLNLIIEKIKRSL